MGRTCGLSEHGAALLNLLAALVLIQIILFSGFAALRVFRTAAQRLAEMQHDYRLRSRIRLLVGNALEDAETSCLAPGWRVNSGRIADIFGRDHPLEHNTPKTQPAAMSDSLSLLALDFTAVYETAPGAAPPGSLLLCRRSPVGSAAAASGSRTWLAAGLDGFIEVQGELRRAVRTSACGSSPAFHGEFRRLPAPMFGDWQAGAEHLTPDKEAQLINAARLFIAIRESFTFYVSGENVLRRAAHDLKTNQPLVDQAAGVELRQPDGRLRHTLGFRLKQQGKPRNRDIVLEFALPRALQCSVLDLLR